MHKRKFVSTDDSLMADGILIKQLLAPAGGIKDKPTTKTSLEAAVENVFRTHKIFGLGFIWIDRLTSGYRVKCEGLERVPDDDYAELEKSFKKAFGVDFIKLKRDKELEMIGHRPVPRGLTTYRLWLRHEVKSKFDQLRKPA